MVNSPDPELRLTPYPQRVSSPLLSLSSPPSALSLSLSLSLSHCFSSAPAAWPRCASPSLFPYSVFRIPHSLSHTHISVSYDHVRDRVTYIYIYIYIFLVKKPVAGLPISLPSHRCVSTPSPSLPYLTRFTPCSLSGPPVNAPVFTRDTLKYFILPSPLFLTHNILIHLTLTAAGLPTTIALYTPIRLLDYRTNTHLHYTKLHYTTPP